MRKPAANQELGIVPNWITAQRAVRALFNECGIDAHAMTWEGQDTSFSYMIYTEKKLTKTGLSHAIIWLSGFVQGQRYE